MGTYLGDMLEPVIKPFLLTRYLHNHIAKAAPEPDPMFWAQKVVSAKSVLRGSLFQPIACFFWKWASKSVMVNQPSVQPSTPSQYQMPYVLARVSAFCRAMAFCWALDLCRVSACCCALAGCWDLIRLLTWGGIACLLGAGIILPIDYSVCIGFVLSPAVVVVESLPAWLVDSANVADYDWGWDRRSRWSKTLRDATHSWGSRAASWSWDLWSTSWIWDPRTTAWSWRRYLNSRLEVWSQAVFRSSMKLQITGIEVRRRENKNGMGNI